MGALFKEKKVITITNAFQKNLDGPNCKSNKILVDTGSEFYNRSVKPWLQDNNREVYLRHSEGKSVFNEVFVRTFTRLKKYMALISKMCILIN